MRTNSILAGVWALAATGAVLAQTVNVSITSPQNGFGVEPGAAVTYAIGFTVSGGDNAGLALLSVDLIQDAGNPETLDIPPADNVPAGMSNFSRPAGISNPGETNPATGYTGVQRGPDGAKNLIQIGGGQNNFGQALPGGSGVAENANVVGGVGQSGSQTLATGSFLAPATEGTYSFSLANVRANVLTAVNTPPAVSPAVAGTVNVAAGTITFTVEGAAPCVGDLDGDNDVDLTDLAILLSNFGTVGGVDPSDGDIDDDDDVDLTDLALLLAAFGTFCG